jgi:beta-glucosidase
VQGDDVSAADRCVAGLCHYPGQSEPVSGLERGAMEISERKLRSLFLPRGRPAFVMPALSA